MNSTSDIGASDWYTVQVRGDDRALKCRADRKLVYAIQDSPHAPLNTLGCRGGGCGVCRIRVLEGRVEALKMSQAHVSESERAEGIYLSCRVFPRSDLVIEWALDAELERRLKRSAGTA